MSADLLKLCDPISYYDKFLSEGIYPDGRSISSFSNISFKKHCTSDVGSALVKQGGVTVACAASASVTLENDQEMVILNIDACTSLTQKNVREINDIVMDLFKVDSIVDKNTLLCRGTEDTVRLYWRLTFNIQVLNSDGCVADAVIGAVVASLSDIRLPVLSLSHAPDDPSPIQKNEITLLEENYHLTLKDFPVASTFAFYESDFGKEKVSCLLADPSTELLNLCKFVCTVVMGEKDVLLLRTTGQLLDIDLLEKICDLAKKRRDVVYEAVSKN